MPLSRANPYWTFMLWLTFHRRRQGPGGDLVRFVDAEVHNWPGRRDKKGLRAYLQEHNAALLPHLEEAWEENEKAIVEGWEY